MKKVVIGLVIIILLAAAAWFAYTRYSSAQAAQAEAVQFETAPIERGELVSTINALGKVRSGQSADLNWETSGTVEEVLVAIGQQVKTGDILAKLEQTSLPESVITAQADLTDAKLELEDLQLNADTSRIKSMQDIVTYEQAVRDAQYALDNFTVTTSQENMSAVEGVKATKAALEAARKAFEPYKFDPAENPTRRSLLERLNSAQSEYNAAIKRLKYEYDLTVAEANLEKALHDFEKYQSGPSPADIEAVQARIAAAQATINQAMISAPFDGTVTDAIPQVGDQVTATKKAFRLDDLSSLYVDLEVSEIDINQVKPGQPVSISIDAIPGRQYQGEVTRVAMISSAEGDSVNFTVTVQLTDPDEQVLPGMTSQVEIVVAQKENVLLVPNQAVRLENGKQVVYTLDLAAGPAPVQVEVTLGYSSETHSELLTGDLQEGDLVVLNPTEVTASDSPRMFFRPGGGGGGNRNQP
jgi:HlyD family secretion protein